MAEQEDKIIEERKEKVLDFIKHKYNWIVYIILAIIAYFAYYVRTLNASGLRDVSTGGWTLGPDLDPFLFLRWAKYIVQHGSLMVLDTMRNVPLGFVTKKEYLLLSYLISYFHKFASFFGSGSFEQSAALYPAFMFVLTVIAFFFLARKVFVDYTGTAKSNIIALISSIFLIILPPLVPRTIAGIPGKESTAFLFMFLSFYLFISAWKARTKMNGYILAVLAGASSAVMSLIWGGSAYIFYTLSVLLLLLFIFNSIDLNKTIIYLIWIVTSSIVFLASTLRFSILDYVKAIHILIIILVTISSFILLMLRKEKAQRYISQNKFLSKIPLPVLSLSISIIVGLVLILITAGPGFISDKISEILQNLITPIITRLSTTVAENMQPYFLQWSNNFGPVIGNNFPIFFWLFFFGSIFLYYKTIIPFTKKERIILSLSYVIFLICIIFSRYSGDSLLNGTNGFSLFVYALGFIILAGSIGYYYYKIYQRGEQHKLKEMNIGFLFVLVFFFLGIISSRGAVRLIMMLVPSTALIVSYFIVESVSFADKLSKSSSWKILAWMMAALITIASLYSAYYLYQETAGQAASMVPSVYNQQWQYAMSWVRTNTPQDAVFAHWWDYGYWVQFLGQRATVVDGGNVIEYWDYLMGRNVLTTPDDWPAIDFLYSHNTTNLLIDSSDIGKYGAFSSIGSDKNYDRASWISAFAKQQSSETKNGSIMLYSGGTSLDADILYSYNGTDIALPSGKAGAGGFLIEKYNNGSLARQPYGIYVYQNQQYNLPLRYAYYNGAFVDFGSGINAGVFVMPLVTQTQSGISIDNDGSLLYLSNRTVTSLLARLYLYNSQNQYFKLVHSEDDILVKQLKANHADLKGDIVYFGGSIRGPIRIWEIEYPNRMQVNQTYLLPDYPDKSLQLSTR